MRSLALIAFVAGCSESPRLGGEVSIETSTTSTHTLAWIEQDPPACVMGSSGACTFTEGTSRAAYDVEDCGRGIPVNAGMIGVASAGLTFHLSPDQLDHYTDSLPEAPLAQGTPVHVTASGWDVLAFEGDVAVPDQVTITTQPDTLALDAPMSIQWTGGSGEVVFTFYSALPRGRVDCAFPASANSATFSLVGLTPSINSYTGFAFQTRRLVDVPVKDRHGATGEVQVSAWFAGVLPDGTSASGSIAGGVIK